MTHYVIREDGIKVEGLTKEQVYEIINGTTGEVPEGVDEEFITKLRELNAGDAVSVWVGTNAEYNAIEEKQEGVLYIIADSTFYEDLEATLTGFDEKIQAVEDNMAQVESDTESTLTQMQSDIEEINNNLSYVYDKMSAPPIITWSQSENPTYQQIDIQCNIKTNEMVPLESRQTTSRYTFTVPHAMTHYAFIIYFHVDIGNEDASGTVRLVITNNYDPSKVTDVSYDLHATDGQHRGYTNIAQETTFYADVTITGLV